MRLSTSILVASAILVSATPIVQSGDTSNTKGLAPRGVVTYHPTSTTDCSTSSSVSITEETSVIDSLLTSSECTDSTTAIDALSTLVNCSATGAASKLMTNSSRTNGGVSASPTPKLIPLIFGDMLTQASSISDYNDLATSRSGVATTSPTPIEQSSCSETTALPSGNANSHIYSSTRSQSVAVASHSIFSSSSSPLSIPINTSCSEATTFVGSTSPFTLISNGSSYSTSLASTPPSVISSAATFKGLVSSYTGASASMTGSMPSMSSLPSTIQLSSTTSAQSTPIYTPHVGSSTLLMQSISVAGSTTSTEAVSAPLTISGILIPVQSYAPPTDYRENSSQMKPTTTSVGTSFSWPNIPTTASPFGVASSSKDLGVIITITESSPSPGSFQVGTTVPLTSTTTLYSTITSRTMVTTVRGAIQNSGDGPAFSTVPMPASESAVLTSIPAAVVSNAANASSTTPGPGSLSGGSYETNTAALSPSKASSPSDETPSEAATTTKSFFTSTTTQMIGLASGTEGYLLNPSLSISYETAYPLATDSVAVLVSTSSSSSPSSPTPAWRNTPVSGGLPTYSASAYAPAPSQAQVGSGSSVSRVNLAALIVGVSALMIIV